FMKNLRQLSKETGTTIIAIHHTHKLFDRPLSMDNIAGSRVVAQELDFMIGINRTISGCRYIKDLAFRYAPCESESVRVFEIDDRCWLNVIEEEEESKLLAAPDGRRSDANANKIMDFLSAKAETETPYATWAELETQFIPGEMS